MTEETQIPIGEIRDKAELTIASIDRNLEKWKAWYPNPGSEVEVPRNGLLALTYFARIGLAERPIDDYKPAELGVVYEDSKRRIEVEISGVGELSACLTVLYRYYRMPPYPLKLCVVKTLGDVRRLLVGLGLVAVAK